MIVKHAWENLIKKDFNELQNKIRLIQSNIKKKQLVKWTKYS